MFLGRGILKLCSKFTGEHPCPSAISIKLLCNFIETVLRHGCSPVNLLHIFRTALPRNTSGWLLLGFSELLFGIWWLDCFTLNEVWIWTNDALNLSAATHNLTILMPFPMKKKQTLPCLTLPYPTCIQEYKKIRNDGRL